MMSSIRSKKNKKKLYSFIGLTAVAITTAATVLPGVTYKYNYDRYVATNKEQVIDIGNSSYYNPSKPVTTTSDIISLKSGRADPAAGTDPVAPDPSAPTTPPTAPDPDPSTPAPDPAPAPGPVSAVPAVISPDGTYYTVHNNISINNPRPNESIDFGPTFDILDTSKKAAIPYASTIAAYPYKFGNTADKLKTFGGAGLNYFGTKSSLYAESGRLQVNPMTMSSDWIPTYRYPTGFLTHPVIDPSTASTDPFKLTPETKFQITYKNMTWDPEHTGSGWNDTVEENSGGLYKPWTGRFPKNFKRYSDVYDNNNDYNVVTGDGGITMTGIMTYDIKGNKLSELAVSPRESAWYYLNQTTLDLIRDGFSFAAQEWYLKDYTLSGAPEQLFKSSAKEKFQFKQDFNFVNYVPEDDGSGATNDHNNDWVADNTSSLNIHAASVTIGTSYSNRLAIVQQKIQYIYPALDFYTPETELGLNQSLVTAPKKILDYPSISGFPGIRPIGSYDNMLPSDSHATSGEFNEDVYKSQRSVASVTFALTPALLEGKFVFIPMVYSGTTRLNTRAIVEPNDKNCTPLEYVTRGLYAVGSKNGVDKEADKDADFKVDFKTNGYPGCEFGSTNKLYLNNVAGTIRWEYNPGTVLRNGLIRPASDKDIKSVYIAGFNRIPGVTKIAESVDTQSPYTLAQDVAKDEIKLYKLIYNLAITNLPDVRMNSGDPDWSPDTLEQMQKIMTVSNVRFSNIGEKTATGYPGGGYIEADVSLKLYYNDETNLIQPSMNKPSPAKTVRLYGFQHVEPTRVPEEDIYLGDPRMTPSQAVEENNVGSLKQYIIQGMSTKVTPTFENDWRKTKGGTLPVNDKFPDYTKIIQFLTTPTPNNLDGTVFVNVTLAAYYDENGDYRTDGFKSIPVTIRGFKKVEQTKLNSTVTISSDRTASEALSSSTTTSTGLRQYPYLQYLLTKYKNEVFTGLPEGFNAGVIQLNQPQADNLRGTVTVQVSVLMYYDQSGNLIDLTKNTEESLGKGPKPLGQIIVSGFKKVAATALKNKTINVSGELEFYNTLASQIDETKVASLIYQRKDEIFTSYPGLRFSINSIRITSLKSDNLTGKILVEFALTRYYNQKGEYVEVDDSKKEWLQFTGKNALTIGGFTSVVQTQWNKKEFDASFKPEINGSDIVNKTSSVTTLADFKAFVDGKNSTKEAIFGGSKPTPFVVKKTNTGTPKKPVYSISLKGPERSAWEILQLGTKTIFQISPQDIATYVLRVFQYAGMQNYGVNVKISDVGVKIITDRNQQRNSVVNTSNQQVYKDFDWYKGSLKLEITVKLSDGTWTKTFDFQGSPEKSMNVFNRYTPLPVFVSADPNGEKNLAKTFTAGDIEHFIFQNIDQIINGSFAEGQKSGKPVNFSNFNINISNIFYNNNQGSVSVLLTIDNFYDAKGNLSTDLPESDKTSPRTMSDTITFTGFKQQKATAFASEFDLADSGAVIPVNKVPVDPNNDEAGYMDVSAWDQMTADQFWYGLKSNIPEVEAYGKGNSAQSQFIYDLIMGNGKVLPPTGAIPNKNRILLKNAEIPESFSVENIIGTDATFSNVDGRLDITFKIVNYYDLLGNLETTAPKTSKISIRGFKQTQASVLAGTKFTDESIVKHQIKVTGSYNTTASLVTPQYIIDNVLNNTRGSWPATSEGGEDTNTYDFVSHIKKGSLNIVAANNSAGTVTLNFFLETPVQIYDELGNKRTLEPGVYSLEVSGFESTLLVYVGLSILIVFVLFILLPTIIIIVKKSRVKHAARGSFKDFK